MAVEDDAKRQAGWDDVLLNHEQIVFARVTPAHKLLIVENNQRLKRVVAVTGASGVSWMVARCMSLHVMQKPVPWASMLIDRVTPAHKLLIVEDNGALHELTY